MTDWLFLPPWGIRLVALAAVSLAALGAMRALRERTHVPILRQAAALVLRGLVIAALALVALNPTAVRPRQIPGKPVLAALVDTSFSMATADAGGKPRLEAALEILADPAVRAGLEEHFTLRAWTFDKDLRPADLGALEAGAAEGRASDLGSAVAGIVGELSEGAATAGILLVSDGRSTEEGATEAARLALAQGVPLWTWCLGGEVPRRDLWIEAPAAEVLAFAESEVDLSATLHAVGYRDRAFDVQVLRDTEVVQTVRAVPQADGTAEVKARIVAPAQGEHRYAFRVEPDLEEAEKDNNERSVFLRVVGEKVRVLAVEGQPHWDTKFLVQCLKRHPRVELTALYRLADKRYFAVMSAGGEQERTEEDVFPRTAEDFARYDVLILGRGCEALFDEHTDRYLGDFVAKQGGGLIFSRGKAYGGRFATLAKLEPVIWGEGAAEGLHLVPSPAGHDSPVLQLAAAGEVEDLFNRLPALDRITQTVGVKPLAVVLADADTGDPDDRPVILAYQQYGQGRVVTVNASGLWRWAFRERATQSEETVYEQFWIAMLRWILSGSDFLAGADVALRSDRRLYTDEQQMQFLVRTRGVEAEAYRPRLRIRGDAGETTVEPRPQPGGTYLAEAGPFPPGRYEVVLENNVGRPAELRLALEVASSSVENRVLSADPDLMARLSGTSEGRPVAASDVARLPQIVREWRARRELAEDRIALWDRWALLAALVGVLGVEWFLRRREGLL